VYFPGRRISANLSRVIALAAMVITLAPLSVFAQTDTAAPPPPRVEAPPYEEQMLRLSEILGAMHHLSAVCEADEKSPWRDMMGELMDAEDPARERKRLYIDRFNRGYKGFAQVYRRCTPSAESALQRYRDEGAKLAKEIATRYSR